MINHLFNFAWPAFALAVLLPLLTRWTCLGRSSAAALPRHMLVLAVINLAVLVGGLWWFGNDGKMVTYIAMAVASACSIWILVKAWRP